MTCSLIEDAPKIDFFVEIFLMFSRLTHTFKSLSSMRWNFVGFDNTSGSFVIGRGLIGCPCACSCFYARFTAHCLRVEACLFFEEREQFVGPSLSSTGKSMIMLPLSYYALWVVLCGFLLVVGWLSNTWLGSLVTLVLSGACTSLTMFRVHSFFIEFLVTYSTICIAWLSSSDSI